MYVADCKIERNTLHKKAVEALMVIVIFSILVVITKFSDSYIDVRLLGLGINVVNAVGAGMIARSEIVLAIIK